MESNDLGIGRKIQHFRKTRGYSQEVFAEILGMSSAGYAKIEREETQVTFEQIKKIADKLDVTPAELVSFGEKNIYFIHAEAKDTGTALAGYIINNNLPEDYLALKALVEELKEKLLNK